MNIIKVPRWLFFILSVALLTVGQGNKGYAAEEEVSRIAVLPFVIEVSEYKHLSDGLKSMLTNRLIAKTDAVETAQAMPVGLHADFDPAELALQLKADYLVVGKFHGRTDALEITVSVSRGAGSDARTEKFTVSVAGGDDIARAVDSLAWDIAVQVFGKQRPAPDLPEADLPESVSESESEKTSHPLKVFISNDPLLFSRGFIDQARVAGVPDLPYVLQAMDVGDVDGDKVDEIIVAAGRTLRLYRRGEKGYELADSLQLDSGIKIHSVNLADLDADNEMEVYISATGESGPRSFGVKWRGENLRDFFINDVGWYLRPMHVPGMGMILAGQQSSDLEGWVSAGIYQLEVTAKGKVRREGRLPVPRQVNLFEFVMADINGDGDHEIVVIGRDDRLQVLDESGKRIWISEEYYGGSMRFLGPVPLESSPQGRIYIPAPPLVHDITGDGLPDIIVNRNKREGSRLFSDSRSYSSGRVVLLTWKENQLVEIWQSAAHDGYVADFQLRPAVAGGQDDKAGYTLYVGQVEQERAIKLIGHDVSSVLVTPFGNEGFVKTED